MRMYMLLCLVFFSLQSKADEAQNIAWNIIDTVNIQSVTIVGLNELLLSANSDERDLAVCLLVGELSVVSDNIVLSTLNLYRLINNSADRDLLDIYANNVLMNKLSLKKYCLKFSDEQYRNDLYLLEQLKYTKQDWIRISDIAKKYSM